MNFPESRFTKPRPDCPNPDYWTAPNGQATENQITNLVKAMVIAMQPEVVLESGTHEGHTARMIAEALQFNGHGRLITIEINPDKATAAKQLLEGLPVEVVCSNNLHYKPQGTIDFIWVDGLPTPERIKEWEHFKPYLSANAVAMFHDTGPHRQFRAMLEQDKDWRIVHLPTPRGVSIGVRA